MVVVKGDLFSEKEMPTTTQGQEEELRGSKCQDCGNQAKRDCSYSRCRSCCKNKGFECQTHIKSTWIPVDRRQQREKQPSSTTDRHHFQGDIPKKHKQTAYSALEEFKLPAATNSMAIFRCVQVRSMDDAVNEIAYQTSVNIGGHVFSGLLYDQGPEQSFYARGDSSTSPVDPQQNLSLINASTQTRDGATMAPLLSALSAAHDEPFFPAQAYPFPFAPFRPGPAMPYFSQSKP